MINLFTRVTLLLALAGVLASPISAQTISRFDFNSTASITTATFGPNATYVNPVTVAPSGVAYITAGCGTGVGMDMTVGGIQFEVNNITVRARFRRGATETTGNFYVKDQFIFGFTGARLYARWVVLESGIPQLRTLTTTRTVNPGQFREYEFQYDNCTGEARILDNDVEYGFADFADNCPLLWSGGDAIIGSELDNACNQTPGLDWIVIAGNTNGCLQPLPVELASFSGRMTEKGAELRWTTLSETNNDFFSLERSENGAEFSEFAQIGGAGNSTRSLSYSAIDPAPYLGTTWYRLRQTDFDGNFSYSEIIQVSTEALKEQIKVGPNPSKGLLNVQFSGSQDTRYRLTVRGIGGAVLMESELDTALGYHQQIDLSSLESGIYFVQIAGAQKVWTEKIVLQH